MRHEQKKRRQTKKRTDRQSHPTEIRYRPIKFILTYRRPKRGQTVSPIPQKSGIGQSNSFLHTADQNEDRQTVPSHRNQVSANQIHSYIPQTKTRTDRQSHPTEIRYWPIKFILTYCRPKQGQTDSPIPQKSGIGQSNSFLHTADQNEDRQTVPSHRNQVSANQIHSYIPQTKTNSDRQSHPTEIRYQPIKFILTYRRPKRGQTDSPIPQKSGIGQSNSFLHTADQNEDRQTVPSHRNQVSANQIHS